MLKKITRAELRGKRLDRDCYGANTTTHEYGKGDNRIFCFGLYKDKMDELRDECLNCKANIIYADDPTEKGGVE